MLLFFVVGIDRIENDIVCTIMSLSIQYFTMAAVLWMGAEAVLIFRQLNMGFERASWKLILVPSLVCWSKLQPVPVKILIHSVFLARVSERSKKTTTYNVSVFTTITM